LNIENHENTLPFSLGSFSKQMDMYNQLKWNWQTLLKVGKWSRKIGKLYSSLMVYICIWGPLKNQIFIFFQWKKKAYNLGFDFVEVFVINIVVNIFWLYELIRREMRLRKGRFEAVPYVENKLFPSFGKKKNLKKNYIFFLFEKKFLFLEK